MPLLAKITRVSVEIITVCNTLLDGSDLLYEIAVVLLFLILISVGKKCCLKSIL
jgi:hypothetical protein